LNEEQLIVLLYGLVALRLAMHLFPRIPSSPVLRRTMNEYLDSFIVAGGAALLLITFLIRSFFIPSESMLPTLQVHDYILVDKLIYHFAHPMRGDVLVFHPPHLDDPEKKDFIKRVVAIEGDEIAVQDGQVFLNGTLLDEPYIAEPPISDFGPLRVPKGYIFMMGDNRNNSDDSRGWGPLPLENVVGKAFLIFWPLQRIQLLH
jgi:signal peptidase I